MRHTLLLIFLITGIIKIYSSDIHVRFNGNNAPLEFVNSKGKPDGFGVDLTRLVMSELNLKYTDSFNDISHNLEALRKGEVTLVSSVAYKKYRLEQFYFSIAHSSATYDIVSRKNEPYKNISELSGKKIIVLNSAVSHEEMLKLGDNYSRNLIPVPNMEFGLKLLNSGIGDAAIASNPNARNIILKHGLDNLIFFDSGLPPIEFSFVSNDFELIRKIDKALIKLKSTNEYDRIYYKWYGGQINGKNLHNLYLILFIVIVVLNIILCFSYVLNKRVKSTTLEIRFLTKALNLINGKANTEIFLLDNNLNEIYVLNDGKYEKSGIDPFTTQYRVHPDDIKKYLQSYITGEKIINDETILNLRVFEENDQKYHYYEYVILPIKKEDNVPLKYLYSRREETAQKELISNQKELITRFNMALNSGKLMRWEYDLVSLKSKIVDLEDNEYIFFGKEGIERIHPDDLINFQQFLKKAIKRDTSSSIVIRVKTLGGNYFTSFEITSKTRFDENKKAIAIYGIWRDISEIEGYKAQLKEKIEQLESANERLAAINKDIQDSEKRLRVILKKLPIPIYIKDPNIKGYIYKNDAAINVLKLSKDSDSFEFKKESDEKRYKQIDQNVLNTGEEYMANEKVRLIDGSVKETYVKKILIEHNGQKQILVVRMDMTEQRIAQIAKKILSNSFAALNAFSWHYDSRLGIILYSDALIGNQLNLQRFDTFEKYLHYVFEDDKQKYSEYISNLKNNKHDRFNVTYRFDISGTGNYEWWESRAITEFIEDDYESYTMIYGFDININKQKENERELENKANQLNLLYKKNELILNNISSALVYIDNEFIVQWSNTSNVFIQSMDDPYIVGAKCYELKGQKSPCNKCPVLKALNYNMIFREEFNFGECGVWEAVAIPVTADDGNKIDGVVFKIDNITIRKKLIDDLKESKEKSDNLNLELSSANELMSAIIDEIPSSLFIKDIKNEFRYLLANNSFCKNIAGIPHDEIIGNDDFYVFKNKLLIEKFHRDDLNTINLNINDVYDCGEETVTVDGVERTYLTKKLAVKLSNNNEYLIGQATDITEIKKINENLLIAKERAEISEKLKMAFLANMSHEIRTPLNAIVGFSELLKFSEDQNEKEEYMRVIDNNNQMLLRLIGDILDLSKIESGSIEIKLEEFDIVKAFEENYIIMNKRLNNNQVKLIKGSNTSSFMVNLDRNRVFQVLNNYIMNAIKYTSNGEIIMELECFDTGIKFSVKDTGIGIDLDKQHLVFHRFEKFDEFAQGTGLGLAISKAITETLGGEVGFESEKNVGSTFWALFPISLKKDFMNNK